MSVRNVNEYEFISIKSGYRKVLRTFTDIAKYKVGDKVKVKCGGNSINIEIVDVYRQDILSCSEDDCILEGVVKYYGLGSFAGSRYMLGECLCGTAIEALLDFYNNYYGKWLELGDDSEFTYVYKFKIL